MVAAEFPGVRLVRNARNEGFARPNNTGMRMADGRHILLLNSDTVVQPRALEMLMRFLDTHPEAGACGPMLLYPDGRIQHSAKGFPTLFTHLCDMLFLDRLLPQSRLFGKGEMRYFDYARPASVDHLMAAAFLVRREVLVQVGLLDEDFAIYYNDMDWCYRMKQRGWGVWYVPDARITHYLGSTVGNVNRGFALFQVLHENVLLFYQKHYGRGAVPVYRLFTALGFVLRSLGWTAVRWLRPSDHSRHMMQFSWKTLWWALPVWMPARVAGMTDRAATGTAGTE
jgi:GT2 family glycosyltransferase